MSLFPAYAPNEQLEKCSGQNKDSKDEQTTWLRNDSFIGFGESSSRELKEESDSSCQTDSENDDESGRPEKLISIINSNDSTQNLRATSKRARSPSQKRKKRRKHKSPQSTELSVDDLKIKLDNLGFMDVDPAPSDTIVRKIPSKSKKSKRKLLKNFQKERYFFKKPPDLSECTDDVNEMKKKTEEFNVKLRDNPHDVNLWIEYARFQDSVISESRSRGEKKLSILNKAMESSPNSLELTQEMFSVMETFSTPDTIQSEAKKLLSKNNKNTVAWQWMINSCLFNITKLSSPKVLETFSLALESLFRAFPNEPQYLLDILMECCIFLRQAGLWEQLWLLVQLSLELNLSTPGSNEFRIETKMDEEKLRDTEDDIIVSGLPLGSLWLRLEYLRSCLHFLPLSESDDDPQRVVFSSDVASLLHPVDSSNNLRLIAIMLTSVKVPLMPLSHCAASLTGLHDISWAIESTEFLIASLTHPYLSNKGEKSCLNVCTELLVSPQYLVEDRPGCQQMFETVDSLFQRILQSLQNDEESRDLIALWRMRWFRLVGFKRCSKRAMSMLQAFPHCLPVYTDFALAHAASGETSTALKVLDKAVKHAGSSPLHVGKDKQNKLAYLYKAYVELLVSLDMKLYRNRILKLLYKLTTGKTISDETLDAVAVADVKKRFDAVSREMMLDIANTAAASASPPSLHDVMIPPFQVSWFVCHAWFLYITESAMSARQHMESICSEMKKILLPESITLNSIILENCFETLIHLIKVSSVADCSVSLKPVLRDAVELFPNNLYILNIASSIDILAGRWWSVSPVFLNQSSVYVKLFTVFVYREKMFNFQGSISEDEKTACQKKLYNLVRRTVCEGGQESRRCPLLWRLLLQFVAAQHPSEIKSTFYRALDLCPWVKSIYYDGAKMLPEELGEIQDLIIEKELRIHITCEELEILRQDGNQLQTNDQTDVS